MNFCNNQFMFLNVFNNFQYIWIWSRFPHQAPLPFKGSHAYIIINVCVFMNTIQKEMDTEIDMAYSPLYNTTILLGPTSLCHHECLYVFELNSEGGGYRVDPLQAPFPIQGKHFYTIINVCVLANRIQMDIDMVRRQIVWFILYTNLADIGVSVWGLIYPI